jgi:hypothetical protein
MGYPGASCNASEGCAHTDDAGVLVTRCGAFCAAADRPVRRLPFSDYRDNRDLSPNSPKTSLEHDVARSAHIRDSFAPVSSVNRASVS